MMLCELVVVRRVRHNCLIHDNEKCKLRHTYRGTVASKNLLVTAHNWSSFPYESCSRNTNLYAKKKLQPGKYSLSTSLTVITLIDISAQITEFYLIKKYHYFIKKFTLSL